MNSDAGIDRIAFVGNYTPRKCGIATFTHDLCEAIAEVHDELTCFAIPVSDGGRHYEYPERVRFHIEEAEIDSYLQAADYLNILDVEVVSLQHEFGIFGGPDGRHILELLHRLRMPVITTMHTVLREPTETLKKTAIEVAHASDRIVVMAERGREFLETIYGVGRAKIDVIPHGIPDMPFIDPNFFKEPCGVGGRTTLLTFGLLSPNKGIENVIRALPAIVARHPEVIYVVLGATHPNLVRELGEEYRTSLEKLAVKLGVDGHIVFHNRFVSLEELKEFIGASDIYITPYLNEAQITSGTLAYAFGAGKAVVSTPYWHAQELLKGGMGRLVPFGDSKAIASSVNDLIENETERHSMRRAAYLQSRNMVWPVVAERYFKSFLRARQDHASLLLAEADHAEVGARTASRTRRPIPKFRSAHVEALTDTIGIWQHARLTAPRFEEGYCTDDNARALLLMVQWEMGGEGQGKKLERLATTYIAFLDYAFNRDNRRFRNFLSFDRRWTEDAGSEDSHARAIWSLGTVVGKCANDSLRTLSAQLFIDGLPAVETFSSPRAWSYALLGIAPYLVRFPGDDRAEHLRDYLMQKLRVILRQARSEDWPWFERVLTYGNARLPQGLLVGAKSAGNGRAADEAIVSLDWLMKVQTGETGCFSPVGSNGWYPAGGNRARYDQQAIEVCASVSACLTAFEATRDDRWLVEAQRSFDWFLGENDMGLPIYDSATGGCRDGLHVDRVSLNQGAESTLSFHLARSELLHVISPAAPTGEAVAGKKEHGKESALSIV